MMEIINSLLGIIFPERDDAARLRKINSLLPYYSPTKESGFVALSEFSEPIVRAAIHEVKFHRNEKAVSLLAELLVKYLKTCSSETVLIPIPLSKERRKERKYNQIELVVQRVVKHTHNDVINDVVVRVKNTAPQTSLNKAKRRANVKSAFTIDENRAIQLTGRDVILIDDVVTTGATMAAARATLARLQPASITCLALAH